LKDSWGKKNKSKQKKEAKTAPQPKAKKEQIDGEVVPMTESEQALFDKYTNELKLNSEVANTLARDVKLSSFYEEALAELNSPVTLANMVSNEVARELKDKEITELKFSPKQVAELVKMVDDETISTKIAKQVFEDMVKTAESPKAIVEAKGLVQISDPAVIAPIIDEVIAKNPDNVEKFLKGNEKLLGFFVGQVLKSTKGKGNPKIVNELVLKNLEEKEEYNKFLFEILDRLTEDTQSIANKVIKNGIDSLSVEERESFHKEVGDYIVDICPKCFQPVSLSDGVFVLDEGMCSTCLNNWSKNYSN
ncbi:MAG TPA: hypothetical protein ENK66_10175, partial [Arcobacter sp.]|nr:hypothetical protein [Arcobacter sp.]